MVTAFGRVRSGGRTQYKSAFEGAFERAIDHSVPQEQNSSAISSYNAGWSPNGRKIVFAHHRALGPTGDIYTINAGRNRRPAPDPQAKAGLAQTGLGPREPESVTCRSRWLIDLTS